MSAVLEQLGLDSTFFIQFGIVAAVFFILSRSYFCPFLRLFELRHKKTVEDRESAEKLTQQAGLKLAEYTRRLSDERLSIRQEFEKVLAEAKHEESVLLAHAREDAKKITQEANDAILKQRDQLREALTKDVEKLAQDISDKLLSRKG
ncbi:ATP synthase F0 subunit B [Bdellovibrionota bacterium FG-2]